MQYAEGLTDEQAAAAAVSRIDWKYALGFKLAMAGFHHSILSEHRDRLLSGGAEQQLLDEMLKQFQAKGLLKAGGRQRSASTHVLAAIRDINRLEMVGETLRSALNTLAVAVPGWWRQQLSADWFELYGPGFEQYRLPKAKGDRQALAERIGQDGRQLLLAIYGPTAPDWLGQVAAVNRLRQVWLQQYWVDEVGQLRLRAGEDLPPVDLRMQTPYDPEARYSEKRQTVWTGYKVHVTETCEDETPHLITHVETTAAAQPDKAVTATLHEKLSQKGLLPDPHLVDPGYTDSDLLVISQQEYALELLGPVQLDNCWQAKTEQAYAAADFVIDWEQQQATCPEGKLSRAWRPRHDKYDNPIIEIWFERADCTPCLSRARCTRAKTNPRTLKIKPQAQYIALQTARQYQTTAEFKQRYNKRAGMEGTISQGVRAFDLRCCRYIGLAKTRLQHLLTAAAINLTRAVSWLEQGVRPRRPVSRFADLAPT